MKLATWNSLMGVGGRVEICFMGGIPGAVIASHILNSTLNHRDLAAKMRVGPQMRCAAPFPLQLALLSANAACSSQSAQKIVTGRGPMSRADP